MVTFGKPTNGRVLEEIGFYDTPTQPIPANSLYFPTTATNCFGVNTEPWKEGDHAYFACQGTFAFTNDAVASLVYAKFAPVYATVTGQIGVPAAAGTKFIGYAAEEKTASDPTLTVMLVVPATPK